MGSPQSIPNCFTVRVHAFRVLKDKWPSIIDAIEPGGTGDPYAGLNDDERPEQVRHNPLVIASYLRTDVRSIQRSGVPS